MAKVAARETTACMSYLKVVCALLNEGRVHVNVKGEYGNMAIIGASLTGDSEVIRLLEEVMQLEWGLEH